MPGAGPALTPASRSLIHQLRGARQRTPTRPRVAVALTAGREVTHGAPGAALRGQAAAQAPAPARRAAPRCQATRGPRAPPPGGVVKRTPAPRPAPAPRRQRAGSASRACAESGPRVPRQPFASPFSKMAAAACRPAPRMRCLTPAPPRPRLAARARRPLPAGGRGGAGRAEPLPRCAAGCAWPRHRPHRQPPRRAPLPPRPGPPRHARPLRQRAPRPPAPARLGLPLGAPSQRPGAPRPRRPGEAPGLGGSGGGCSPGRGGRLRLAWRSAAGGGSPVHGLGGPAAGRRRP